MHGHCWVQLWRVPVVANLLKWWKMFFVILVLRTRIWTRIAQWFHIDQGTIHSTWWSAEFVQFNIVFILFIFFITTFPWQQLAAFCAWSPLLRYNVCYHGNILKPVIAVIMMAVALGWCHLIRQVAAPSSGAWGEVCCSLLKMMQVY